MGYLCLSRFRQRRENDTFFSKSKPDCLHFIRYGNSFIVLYFELQNHANSSIRAYKVVSEYDLQISHDYPADWAPFPGLKQSLLRGESATDLTMRHCYFFLGVKGSQALQIRCGEDCIFGSRSTVLLRLLPSKRCQSQVTTTIVSEYTVVFGIRLTPKSSDLILNKIIPKYANSV